MWDHSPARSKVSEEAISASRLILDCRQNCGKLSHWLEVPSLCILPYKILTKLEPKRLLPPPSVTFMRKYALARPARLSSFWAETTQHWAITIFFFNQWQKPDKFWDQYLVPLEFHTTVVFELDYKRPGVASVYSTNSLLCFLGNSREQQEGSQLWLCGMEGTVETVWLSFALYITIVTNWYNLEELK